MITLKQENSLQSAENSFQSVSLKVIPLRTDPVYPSCEEVLAICCAFVLWSSVWGEQQPDGVGMVDEGVVTELHYSGILLQAHSI